MPEIPNSRWVREHLAEEIRAVRNAPLAFILAVGLLSFGIAWVYRSAEVDGLRATLEARDERIRLLGERCMALPSSGRRLSPEERAKLAESLTPFAESGRIDIDFPIHSPEPEMLAAGIARAIRLAGIDSEVSPVLFGGPAPLGISIRYHPSNPAGPALIRGLHAIGIVAAGEPREDTPENRVMVLVGETG